MKRAINLSIMDILKNKLLFFVTVIILITNGILMISLYSGYLEFKSNTIRYSVDVYPTADKIALSEKNQIIDTILDNHLVTITPAPYIEDNKIKSRILVTGFDKNDPDLKTKVLQHKRTDENEVDEDEEIVVLDKSSMQNLEDSNILNIVKGLDLSDAKAWKFKDMNFETVGIKLAKIEKNAADVISSGFIFTLYVLIISITFVIFYKVIEYIAYKMTDEYQIHYFYGAKNKDIILRCLCYYVFITLFIQLFFFGLYRRSIPQEMNISIVIQVVILFVSHIIILNSRGILYRKEKQND